MGRSVKKGPYVQPVLLKRIQQMNEAGEKNIVKTWSRASIIFPDFVGHTIAVHDGRKHVPVYVTEDMVGHKPELTKVMLVLKQAVNNLGRKECFKWKQGLI